MTSQHITDVQAACPNTVPLCRRVSVITSPLVRKARRAVPSEHDARPCEHCWRMERNHHPLMDTMLLSRHIITGVTLMTMLLLATTVTIRAGTPRIVLPFETGC